MPSSKKGRTTLRLAVVAFMTAGMFAAGPELVHREQRDFATRLSRHALDLSAGESLASVRHLALIGQPAIDPLVKLAASQRTDVAQAAQKAVADELAAWEVKFTEDLDHEAFGSAISTLTEAIGAHYREFGADGRRWAERLARRLAEHGANLPGSGAWRAVTLYDRLMSAEKSASGLRSPAPAVVFSESGTTAEALRPSHGVKELAAPPARRLTPAATVKSLPTPTAPSTSEGSLTPIQPTPPRVSSIPIAAAPKPLAESDKPVDAAINQRVAAISPIVDVPSPQELRHSLQEYRQYSDRQLISQLETAPRYQAAAMRKVLAGRGYSNEMLNLTHELEKLPAPQRLTAIERAATLPSKEARLLLRWFLADDDGDVRLQALTTLATSGDPKMTEIARRCAVEDADPRVADLASKLLRQR